MTSGKKRTSRALPSKSQAVLRTAAGRASGTAAVVSTGDAMPNIQRLLSLPPTKGLDCMYALHKFDRFANRGDLADSPPKVRKRLCSSEATGDGKTRSVGEESKSPRGADDVGALHAEKLRQALELQQAATGRLPGEGCGTGVAMARRALSQDIAMDGTSGVELSGRNQPPAESSVFSPSRVRRSATPCAPSLTTPLFGGDWQSNVGGRRCDGESGGGDEIPSCGPSGCVDSPGHRTGITRDEECGGSATFERRGDAASSTASSVPSPAASIFAPSPAGSAFSQPPTVCSQPQSACCWQGCTELVATTALLQHLEEAHLRSRRSAAAVLPSSLLPSPSSVASRHAGLSPEASGDACLWLGCKVFGKAARTAAWLDGHVVRKHVPKAKLFACVFLCGKRFSSLAQRNTHVARVHCDDRCSGASTPATAVTAAGKQRSVVNNGARVGCEAGCSGSAAPTPKLRKQKKLPRGLQPCVRKTEDFFDATTCELLEERLQATMTFWRRLGLDLAAEGRVKFRSEVVARRADAAERVQLLLRWQPTGFLDDSWIPEDELDRHRERQLTIDQVQRIQPASCRLSSSSVGGSRKRKFYGGRGST